jgi:hypothetical protein
VRADETAVVFETDTTVVVLVNLTAVKPIDLEASRAGAEDGLLPPASFRLHSAPDGAVDHLIGQDLVDLAKRAILVVETSDRHGIPPLRTRVEYVRDPVLPVSLQSDGRMSTAMGTNDAGSDVTGSIDPQSTGYRPFHILQLVDPATAETTDIDRPMPVSDLFGPDTFAPVLRAKRFGL